MRIDDHLIEEIVRRVRRVADPERIILFGSAATGNMTADSDIDLLVLVTRPQNPRTLSVQIGDALRGLGHAFDIIVMTTARFEESKSLIGGIAYPASKYGRVIHEAARACCPNQHDMDCILSAESAK